VRKDSALGQVIAANRRAIALVVLGTVLIFLYGIVAKFNSLFAFPPLERPHYLFLSPREAASVFWKILLLFPASVFIAAGVSATGFSLRLSRILAWKRLPTVLVLGSAIAIAVSILVVFRATEVTDDELTYLYQAKTFLAGRLYNPPPPVPEAFDNQFILQLPGKMVGKYSFAHPLMLALGMLCGSPYVVTLLLSTLLIPLVIGIGRRLYRDSTVALLAGILLAISPFFYGMSSTLLSHTTSAFFLALSIYLTLGWLEDRAGSYRILRGVAAGAAFGVAFNIRPLTAIAFAIPLAGLVITRMIQRKTRPDVWFVGLVSGAAILFAATLVHNSAITGDPLTFPYTLVDPNDRLGFSSGYIQTLWQMFLSPGLNIARLNLMLLGMPVSLIFAGLMLLRPRLEAGDLYCYFTVATLAVAYVCFWFPGVGDVGPVYYYETIIPLVLLTARGILWLREAISTRFPAYRTFVSWFCLTSVLCSFWIVCPEQTLYLSNLTKLIRRPYQVIQDGNIHHAVIFLKDLPDRGWVKGYRNNDPDFTNDVILCRPGGTREAEVMKAFPDREYYRLFYTDGPQLVRLERIPPP
jgi:hypothetical protein